MLVAQLGVKSKCTHWNLYYTDCFENIASWKYKLRVRFIYSYEGITFNNNRKRIILFIKRIKSILELHTKAIQWHAKEIATFAGALRETCLYRLKYRR